MFLSITEDSTVNLIKAIVPKSLLAELILNYSNFY